MKRKTIKRTCYTISALLVLAGLGDIGYNHADSYIARSYRPTISRKMIANDKRHHGKITFNEHNVKPVDTTEEIQQSQHDKSEDTLGQMVVPSVGLHLPITAGTGNNLLNSAGTGSASQKMGQGNYVLFGHHMRSNVLFTPLYDKAKIGTKVYITDDSIVYVYRINQRSVISDKDFGVMNQSKKPIISLVTCEQTLGGNTRLLLRGDLIKRYRYDKAPKPLLNDMEAPTNNHDVLRGY